ncbi:MAG TPA: flagellar basal body rod protein FlgC [Rhodospirillales bacterium]|jgi:flagellar basal-body rod protein FlgC|nr:flagellar basal body rod protein FlgC [Rhodospirillales bacterium]
MDDILRTMRISAAGMRTQGTRLRVISENVANADSLPTAPGDLPYRRKTVTFRNELDRATGTELVTVDRIGVDASRFSSRYEPGHPAADAAGYVLTPNVNTLIEMTDMREAQRSYEANLNVIKSSKAMLNETIDVLR